VRHDRRSGRIGRELFLWRRAGRSHRQTKTFCSALGKKGRGFPKNEILFVGQLSKDIHPLDVTNIVGWMLSRCGHPVEYVRDLPVRLMCSETRCYTISMPSLIGASLDDRKVIASSFHQRVIIDCRDPQNRMLYYVANANVVDPDTQKTIGATLAEAVAERVRSRGSRRNPLISVPSVETILNGRDGDSPASSEEATSGSQMTEVAAKCGEEDPVATSVLSERALTAFIASGGLVAYPLAAFMLVC